MLFIGERDVFMLFMCFLSEGDKQHTIIAGDRDARIEGCFKKFRLTVLDSDVVM
jgi:hypothetical protein